MKLHIRAECNDGHIIEVNGGSGFLDWAPFDVAQFRSTVLNRQPLQLAVHKANTSVRGPTSNFAGERYVEFEWPTSFPLKVFALVPGGWLPAAVCESTLLLPDANLAGSFSEMDDEASKLRAATGLQDVPLMSMGANRISAALAAFEGSGSDFPTYHQFADRMKKIARRLERGFPERDVIFPSQQVTTAAFTMLKEEQPAYSRNATYLASAFPLISHRIQDSMLARRHEELEELAVRCGVSPCSFVYLLTLDCLYDEGPRPKKEQWPGRLVLKPKKIFKDSDLSNALTDILHMDRLCKARLARPAERTVLCTMDHGLTQAWSMLRPDNVRMEGGSPVASLCIDDCFASRLRGDAREVFFERLQSRASA